MHVMNSEKLSAPVYSKKLSSVKISDLSCAGKAPVQDGQEWVSDGGGTVLWGRYLAHLV